MIRRKSGSSNAPLLRGSIFVLLAACSATAVPVASLSAVSPTGVLKCHDDAIEALQTDDFIPSNLATGSPSGMCLPVLQGEPSQRLLLGWELESGSTNISLDDFYLESVSITLMEKNDLPRPPFVNDGALEVVLSAGCEASGGQPSGCQPLKLPWIHTPPLSNSTISDALTLLQNLSAFVPAGAAGVLPGMRVLQVEIKSMPKQQGDPQGSPSQGDPGDPPSQGDPGDPPSQGDPGDPPSQGDPGDPPSQGDPQGSPSQVESSSIVFRLGVRVFPREVPLRIGLPFKLKDMISRAQFPTYPVEIQGLGLSSDGPVSPLVPLLPKGIDVSAELGSAFKRLWSSFRASESPQPDESDPARPKYTSSVIIAVRTDLDVAQATQQLGSWADVHPVISVTTDLADSMQPGLDQSQVQGGLKDGTFTFTHAGTGDAVGASVTASLTFDFVTTGDVSQANVEIKITSVSDADSEKRGDAAIAQALQAAMNGLTLHAEIMRGDATKGCMQVRPATVQVAFSTGSGVEAIDSVDQGKASGLVPHGGRLQGQGQSALDVQRIPAQPIFLTLYAQLQPTSAGDMQPSATLMVTQEADAAVSDLSSVTGVVLAAETVQGYTGAALLPATVYSIANELPCYPGGYDVLGMGWLEPCANRTEMLVYGGAQASSAAVTLWGSRIQDVVGAHSLPASLSGSDTTANCSAPDVYGQPAAFDASGMGLSSVAVTLSVAQFVPGIATPSSVLNEAYNAVMLDGIQQPMAVVDFVRAANGPDGDSASAWADHLRGPGGALVDAAQPLPGIAAQVGQRQEEQGNGIAELLALQCIPGVVYFNIEVCVGDRCGPDAGGVNSTQMYTGIDTCVQVGNSSARLHDVIPQPQQAGLEENGPILWATRGHLAGLYGVDQYAPSSACIHCPAKDPFRFSISSPSGSEVAALQLTLVEANQSAFAQPGDNLTPAGALPPVLGRGEILAFEHDGGRNSVITYTVHTVTTRIANTSIVVRRKDGASMGSADFDTVLRLTTLAVHGHDDVSSGSRIVSILPWHVASSASGPTGLEPVFLPGRPMRVPIRVRSAADVLQPHAWYEGSIASPRSGPIRICQEPQDGASFNALYGEYQKHAQSGASQIRFVVQLNRHWYSSTAPLDWQHGLEAPSMGAHCSEDTSGAQGMLMKPSGSVPEDIESRFQSVQGQFTPAGTGLQITCGYGDIRSDDVKSVMAADLENILGLRYVNVGGMNNPSSVDPSNLMNATAASRDGITGSGDADAAVDSARTVQREQLYMTIVAQIRSKQDRELAAVPIADPGAASTCYDYDGFTPLFAITDSIPTSVARCTGGSISPGMARMYPGTPTASCNLEVRTRNHPAMLLARTPQGPRLPSTHWQAPEEGEGPMRYSVGTDSGSGALVGSAEPLFSMYDIMWPASESYNSSALEVSIEGGVSTVDRIALLPDGKAQTSGDQVNELTCSSSQDGSNDAQLQNQRALVTAGIVPTDEAAAALGLGCARVTHSSAGGGVREPSRTTLRMWIKPAVSTGVPPSVLHSIVKSLAYRCSGEDEDESQKTLCGWSRFRKREIRLRIQSVPTVFGETDESIKRIVLAIEAPSQLSLAPSDSGSRITPPVTYSTLQDGPLVLIAPNASFRVFEPTTEARYPAIGLSLIQAKLHTAQRSAGHRLYLLRPSAAASDGRVAGLGGMTLGAAQDDQEALSLTPPAAYYPESWIDWMEEEGVLSSPDPLAPPGVAAATRDSLAGRASPKWHEQDQRLEMQGPQVPIAHMPAATSLVRGILQRLAYMYTGSKPLDTPIEVVVEVAIAGTGDENNPSNWLRANRTIVVQPASSAGLFLGAFGSNDQIDAAVGGDRNRPQLVVWQAAAAEAAVGWEPLAGSENGSLLSTQAGIPRVATLAPMPVVFANDGADADARHNDQDNQSPTRVALFRGIKCAQSGHSMVQAGKLMFQSGSLGGTLPLAPSENAAHSLQGSVASGVPELQAVNVSLLLSEKLGLGPSNAKLRFNGHHTCRQLVGGGPSGPACDPDAGFQAVAASSALDGELLLELAVHYNMSLDDATSACTVTEAILQAISLETDVPVLQDPFNATTELAGLAVARSVYKQQLQTVADGSPSQGTTVKSTASEPVFVAVQLTEAYPALQASWIAAEGNPNGTKEAAVGGRLVWSVESKDKASTMLPSTMYDEVTGTAVGEWVVVDVKGTPQGSTQPAPVPLRLHLQSNCTELAVHALAFRRDGAFTMGFVESDATGCVVGSTLECPLATARMFPAGIPDEQFASCAETGMVSIDATCPKPFKEVRSSTLSTDVASSTGVYSMLQRAWKSQSSSGDEQIVVDAVLHTSRDLVSDDLIVPSKVIVLSIHRAIASPAWNFGADAPFEAPWSPEEAFMLQGSIHMALPVLLVDSSPALVGVKLAATKAGDEVGVMETGGTPTVSGEFPWRKSGVFALNTSEAEPTLELPDLATFARPLFGAWDHRGPQDIINDLPPDEVVMKLSPVVQVPMNRPIAGFAVRMEAQGQQSGQAAGNNAPSSLQACVHPRIAVDDGCITTVNPRLSVKRLYSMDEVAQSSSVTIAGAIVHPTDMPAALQCLQIRQDMAGSAALCSPQESYTVQIDSVKRGSDIDSKQAVNHVARFPVFKPAQPQSPEVAAAVLSDDGRSIRVNFTTAIQLEELEQGDTQCKHLVAASTLDRLGTSPRCSLEADSRAILLVLGTQAVILPGDAVSLVPGSLRHARALPGQALLSAGQGAQAKLLPPADPVRVSLRASAPATVGACASTASIDLSGTIGQAGRSLAYTLSVSSSLPPADQARLEQLIATAYNGTLLSGLRIAFPVVGSVDKLLEASGPTLVRGYVYGFNISAVNWLGQHGSLPATTAAGDALSIETLADTGTLEIDAIGGVFRSMRRSQSIEVGAMASLRSLSCDAAGSETSTSTGTAALRYSWYFGSMHPIQELDGQDSADTLDATWRQEALENATRIVSGMMATPGHLNPLLARAPSSPKLRIPQATLRAGTAYVFLAKVEMIDSAGEQAVGNPVAYEAFVVRVQRTALQPVIQGGDRGLSSARTHGIQLMEPLDSDYQRAVASQDPGYDATIWQRYLFIDWTCSVRGTACSGELARAMRDSSNASTALIPSGALAPHENEAVTLIATVVSGLVHRTTENVISETVQRGEAQATFQVLPVDLPSISVAVTSAGAVRYNTGGIRIVSASTRTVLSARLSEIIQDESQSSTAAIVLDQGLQVRWSMPSGDLPPRAIGPDAVPASIAHLFGTGLDSDSLVIRPGTLTAGAKYTFAATISKAGTSATMSSQIDLVVNAAPHGGMLGLFTPDGTRTTGGTAIRDTFVLTAMDWTDDSSEDDQLQYAFYYHPGAPASPGADLSQSDEVLAMLESRLTSPLQEFSVASSCRTTLPPPPAGGSQATLIVVVRDELGAVAAGGLSIQLAFPIDDNQIGDPDAWIDVVDSLLDGASTDMRSSDPGAALRRAAETAVMVDGLDGAANAIAEREVELKTKTKQTREAVLTVVRQAVELQGNDSAVSDDLVGMAAKTTGSVLKGAEQTTRRMSALAVANMGAVLDARLKASTGTASVNATQEGVVASGGATGLQEGSVGTTAQRSVLDVLNRVLVIEQQAKALVSAGAADDDVLDLAGQNSSLPSAGGVVRTASLLSRSALVGAVPGESPVMIQASTDPTSSGANSSTVSLSLVSGRVDGSALSSSSGLGQSRRLAGAGGSGQLSIGATVSDASTVPELAAASRESLARQCSSAIEGAVTEKSVDAVNDTSFGMALMFPNAIVENGTLLNAISLPSAGNAPLDVSVLAWGALPHDATDADSVAKAASQSLEQQLAMQVADADTATTTRQEDISGWKCDAVSVNILSSITGAEVDLATMGAEACIVVPRDKSEPAISLGGPLALLSGDAQDAAGGGSARRTEDTGDINTLAGSGAAEASAMQSDQQAAAACMFWDEARSLWSGVGCSAVAVTKTSLVCRCTHLTDFSGRFQLLLSENRAILQGGANLSVQDLVRNLKTLTTVCAIMGVVIVAGIAADQIDAVQHKEFAHSLLQDPEVVFLRGLVRIEGCNEVLDRMVQAGGDKQQLEVKDDGQQNPSSQLGGEAGNGSDPPHRAAGQLNKTTSLVAKKCQGGRYREDASGKASASEPDVAEVPSPNQDKSSGSRRNGSNKNSAPTSDAFAGAFETKPAWERRFTAIRNTVGTVARTLGATYLTAALELGHVNGGSGTHSSLERRMRAIRDKQRQKLGQQKLVELLALARSHAEMEIPGAAEFQTIEREGRKAGSLREQGVARRACGHCCVIASIGQDALFRRLSGRLRVLHRGVTISDGMTAKQFQSAQRIAAQLRQRVKVRRGLHASAESATGMVVKRKSVLRFQAIAAAASQLSHQNVRTAQPDSDHSDSMQAEEKPESIVPNSDSRAVVGRSPPKQPDPEAEAVRGAHADAVSTAAGPSGADHGLHSDNVCVRLWALRWTILQLWSARLAYDHLYLGPFLSFRYASDRVFRLGVLLAVVFVTMAVTVFFYSITGVDRSGIDEDGDGVDDFTPLSMNERVAFACIAAFIKLPALMLLSKIFDGAADQSFKQRYFPLWRELQLRAAAESHLGVKLQALRQQLTLLRARRLAHCYAHSKNPANDEALQQIDRMLRVTMPQDAGVTASNDSRRHPLGSEDAPGDEPPNQQRSASLRAATLQQLEEADVVLESNADRKARIMELQRRLDLIRLEKKRLQVAQAGIKAGHELTRGARCQVDLANRLRISTQWCASHKPDQNKSRLRAMAGLQRAAMEYRDMADELLPQSRGVMDASSAPHSSGVTVAAPPPPPQAKHPALDAASAEASVKDPLPGDIFNPYDLGWVEPPQLVKWCCSSCLVWCNRHESQKRDFLLAQYAVQGRPSGCCWCGRAERVDSVTRWSPLAYQDEEHLMLGGRPFVRCEACTTLPLGPLKFLRSPCWILEAPPVRDSKVKSWSRQIALEEALLVDMLGDAEAVERADEAGDGAQEEPLELRSAAGQAVSSTQDSHVNIVAGPGEGHTDHVPESASQTGASDAAISDAKPVSGTSIDHHVPSTVVEHRRAAVQKARLVRQASGAGVLAGLQRASSATPGSPRDSAAGPQANDDAPDTSASASAAGHLSSPLNDELDLEKELERFFGQDRVMDEILRRTLQDMPERGCSGASKKVMGYTLLSVVIAFTLWYVLAFGIYHGDDIVGDFLSDFWIAQGMSFFLIEPGMALFAIATQVAVMPVLLKQLRWLPCLGTRTEAAEAESSRVLSGRIQNVTLMQATGAAAGVGATESLVLFSVLSAIAPAFTGLGAARGAQTNGTLSGAGGVDEERHQALQESMLEEFVQYRFRSALQHGSNLIQALREEVQRIADEVSGDNHEELIGDQGSPDESRDGKAVAQDNPDAAGEMPGPDVSPIRAPEGPSHAVGGKMEGSADSNSSEPAGSSKGQEQEQEQEQDRCRHQATHLDSVLQAMQRALARALSSNQKYLRANLQQSTRRALGQTRVASVVQLAMEANAQRGSKTGGGSAVHSRGSPGVDVNESLGTDQHVGIDTDQGKSAAGGSIGTGKASSSALAAASAQPSCGDVDDADPHEASGQIADADHPQGIEEDGQEDFTDTDVLGGPAVQPHQIEPDNGPATASQEAPVSGKDGKPASGSSIAPVQGTMPGLRVNAAHSGGSVAVTKVEQTPCVSPGSVVSLGSDAVAEDGEGEGIAAGGAASGGPGRLGVDRQRTVHGDSTRGSDLGVGGWPVEYHADQTDFMDPSSRRQSQSSTQHGSQVQNHPSTAERQRRLSGGRNGGVHLLQPESQGRHTARGQGGVGRGGAASGGPDDYDPDLDGIDFDIFG